MARAPRRHRTVEQDGYELAFYPGFLREATVETGGEEVVLYRQEEPYDIRDRPNEPLTRFVLRLQGGKNKRNVTLRIDDPEHGIAQIVVRFHRPGHEPGGRQEAEPIETATFDNTPFLCPPICEGDSAESGARAPRKKRA